MAIGERPARRQPPRSERRSHLSQTFDLPAWDTSELEHDPERYRRSDRNSAFSLRTALRALQDDPLDARAKLDDGNFIVPFLHGDFAAGADDLEHGFALERHSCGMAERCGLGLPFTQDRHAESRVCRGNRLGSSRTVSALSVVASLTSET